ncbi:MAG: DUF1844 domain-containing protein [Myxococcota bacterium]|nr:DUF1844 domain-containing protein [Myxococcota bacterium]
MDPKSGAEGAEESRAISELPAIDFSTFVLSLSTTALYQMGLVTDPETNETISPSRAIAQQTIDTIEMLREKTRGNLEPDEVRLIDSLLYELRLHFVELDA